MCDGVLQSSELMYSYAVITVDAHKQLSWMHDRMPVRCLSILAACGFFDFEVND